MNSLLLDTATDLGVVGLFQDGKLIAKKEFAAAFTNSRLLLPAIDELMRSAGLEPSQLGFIATGIGPGSYTGIRVAVAVAKALSFALRIPLIGVSSLKGFIPDSGYSGQFLGVIDAKIGGVYCIQGEAHCGEIIFQTEDELCSLYDFAARLKSISCVITPSAKSLRERLFSLGYDELGPFIEKGPSIDILGKLAFDAFLQGKGTTDGHLPLLYLRKTQAELEKGVVQGS